MPSKNFIYLIVLFLSLSCDKIQDSRVLEKDAAKDKRGGIAVMQQALLMADIGRALADTSLFPLPGLFKARMVSKDSFILDTTQKIWRCVMTDTFAGQPVRVRFQLRFGPNYNGYPVFPGSPFSQSTTDTTYMSLMVRDSINQDITRLHLNFNNTDIIYRGYKNWWRTDSIGSIVINGSLNAELIFQIGKNSPSGSDDLDFSNTYQLNFIQVRLVEGNTLPSSGVIGFSINQNLVQEKDGVNNTVAGDYAVTGQVIFNANSVSMKIGEYTFRVVIDANRSIWIGE